MSLILIFILHITSIYWLVTSQTHRWCHCLWTDHDGAFCKNELSWFQVSSCDNVSSHLQIWSTCLRYKSLLLRQRIRNEIYIIFIDMINYINNPYLKCTAVVLMFFPMQFLMFSTTIKCFMTSSTPLICLDLTIGTHKLIRP